MAAIVSHVLFHNRDFVLAFAFPNWLSSLPCPLTLCLAFSSMVVALLDSLVHVDLIVAGLHGELLDVEPGYEEPDRDGLKDIFADCAIVPRANQKL